MFIIKKNVIEFTVFCEGGTWEFLSCRFETTSSTLTYITMDDLVHHCLRELSFDGDLGELRLHIM